MHCGRKRRRQIHVDAHSAAFAAAAGRLYQLGRGAGLAGYWLSAAANAGATGFSGFRVGGCAFRLPGAQWLAAFYSRRDKALARRALRRLEAEELAGRCYRELSGGQQQRVLLARALCAAQKVLLLDEPVSGLDPKVTAEMYRLIAELNRRDGLTIIMISHDIQAAVSYASHILHIGQPVFFGARQEYLQSEIGRSFAEAQEVAAQC